MPPRVQVLYTPDCPNGEPGIALTKDVMSALVPEATVELVQIESEEQARDTGFLGSPTVRVDGRDIEGRDAEEGHMGCRVYPGSQPCHVRPEAIQVLGELGIDISTHHSKSVETIPPESVDTVITLCADEVCPVFLAKATRLHWGLPDPAAVEGDEEARPSAFRAVRDELVKRFSHLKPEPA
jgi:hypothetical protein